jgi:CDP-glycerol glycerophosphotransferase (TagB/SpsB family)
MPTWRKYLLDKKQRPTASFAQSDYVRRWRWVLQSPALRTLLEEYGLRMAFCPHAAVAPFAEVFDPPDYVEVIDQLTTPSLQPLFAKSALLVTDYSSVAFELAYVDKPVVYYQFDAGQFYDGGHVGVRGYFDFATDGFGPVCKTEEDFIACLEAAMSGYEPSHFAERRRTTFAYRDDRCCKRVYESILDLDAPLQDPSGKKRRA